MQFFMILHRLNEILGLSGIRLRRTLKDFFASFKAVAFWPLLAFSGVSDDILALFLCTTLNVSSLCSSSLSLNSWRSDSDLKAVLSSDEVRLWVGGMGMWKQISLSSMASSNSSSSSELVPEVGDLALLLLIRFVSQLIFAELTEADGNSVWCCWPCWPSCSISLRTLFSRWECCLASCSTMSSKRWRISRSFDNTFCHLRPCPWIRKKNIVKIPHRK